MSEGLLYGINERILFVLLVGLFYGGAELGYRYGCRIAERAGAEAHAHVATIEGALP